MYNFKIIAALVLVLFFSLALAYTAIGQAWVIFSLILLGLWLAAVYWLLRSISARDRSFAKILESSKKEDYSFGPLDRGNAQVAELIQLWTAQLRQFKTDQKSLDLRYRNVLNQLNAPILWLKADGSLEALNTAAQALPGMRHQLSPEDWQTLFPFLKDFIASQASEQVIALRQDGEKQQWRLQQHPFSGKQEGEKILVVRNEQHLFESQENEALERILHVLTHEIMNSVSPINSLADTLQLHLKLDRKAEGYYFLTEEQYQDLQSTARIIHRRTNGLMSFVERYARFARLPRIQKESIDWLPFLREIEKLAEEELAKASISVQIRTLNSARRLYADRELLNQVVLNLIRNAQESMDGRTTGQIILELDQGDGYHYLKVIDNGQNIEDALIDQIFLPFFSTKKRGSGIGLSLSRKIVMAHGGRLYLQQKPAYKAFCIDLPF